MKISIITAVFNNQDKISGAIDSVLNQTYTDIEYIIVDGGSSDNTQKIIKSYGDKISKFISEPDNGIYDAINKGISLATGDIAGILHSDDLFENEHVLENVAGAFNTTAADGIYGDLVYIRKEDPEKIVRFWKSRSFAPSLLKKGWMPPHTTLFLKRNIFEKYGIYDTQYKISSDYDFMLRIFSRSELKFIYIQQVITRMRMGGASNRNLKNIIQKSKEDFHALKKNKIGGFGTLLMKNFSKIGQFF